MRIFWSWQSDRPGKTGRHFVRVALNDAVEALKADLPVDDANRPELYVDQDTQGMSGSPDLAQAIFGKIKDSVAVVADITPVGMTKRVPNVKQKALMNSNVAIEVGYTLATIGTEHLLMVMNEAYGKRADTPFDLSHKRGPFFYSLSENASSSEIQAAKKKLTKDLQVGIRACLRV